MARNSRRGLLLRICHHRRRKALLLAVAALPLFQATGCFPDPLGALNFELQSLFNTVLINAVNTIVQNLLGI
ncbi:MAG: hypothetical protein ACE5E1_03785 [Phycisphaerae bacterium]